MIKSTHKAMNAVSIYNSKRTLGQEKYKVGFVADSLFTLKEMKSDGL